MADFNQALKVALRHEGAYVNNPSDKGGPTNFGITAKTLAAYLKQPVSVDQMKTMTIDQAAHIYEQVFWHEMNLPFVNNQALATTLLDLGILMGISKVVKFLQEVLNLPEDGLLGSQTIASLNQYVDAPWLALQIIFRTQIHFADLCDQDESQLQFLTGWIRRSQDLIEIVFHN